MCKNSQGHGFDWQYFGAGFKALALTATASHLPTEAGTACSSRHIRWWNTGGVFSLWQGPGMENIPSVFRLMESATSSRRHTTLPADIRFTRTRKPNWQQRRPSLPPPLSPSSPHPDPEHRPLITSRKRQSKAWARKPTNLKEWEDALEWYTLLSPGLEFRRHKAHKAKRINSFSTVALHAQPAKRTGAAKSIFAIWFRKYIREPYTTAAPSHLVSGSRRMGVCVWSA